METATTEGTGYSFSEDWFSRHKGIWDGILDYKRPKHILEIGSFEGLSASYIVEKASMYNQLAICCVDTWEGGEEHVGIDFVSVEERFDRNMKVAMGRAMNKVELHKFKMESHKALARLMANEIKFDLIYIDGSHMAKDVLSDSVMSFRLLHVGGMMIFDDFLMGNEQTDVLHHPQIAIKSFLTVYSKQMRELTFEATDKITGQVVQTKDLYQYYSVKVAE